MTQIIPRNYQGTRDWLAADINLRQQVIETLRQVFELFGFEPLETPVIELKETLKGKYGEEGDRLSFYFSKGMDDIGLRYDHTVPLARVVAQHLDKLVLPYRRYAIGPVFRADKPQKGRYRQFVQCDFDIVGTTSPMADAEVVALNFTALKRLGFDRFVIEICDRRLLNGMAQGIGASKKEEVIAILRSWDKIDKASREQIAEEFEEAGIGHLVGAFNESTNQLLAVRESKDPLAEVEKLFPKSEQVRQGVDVLKQLLAYVAQLDVPDKFYKINPTLARGLDYYTGPIFETIVQEAGIGSITGGGRFDDLIEALGGPSLPATGSSFGLERITSVMETLGLTKPIETKTEVFVATFDPNSQELVENAIKIVAELRASGFNSEVYMGNDPIGKQLQLADRRGIPIVVFVGPDELKRGTATIKDLTAPMAEKNKLANQWEVQKNSLAEEVRRLLKRR